ncbi:MAG: Ion transport 2 domain protein [Herminiimonas sp.]|nr:Ion transport 2 domain protein [Herminiimonas sp.]
MKIPSIPGLQRPLFFAALVTSIPAFYLLLSGAGPDWRHAGNLLYGLTAVLVALDWRRGLRHPGRPRARSRNAYLDVLVFLGAVVSAWPTDPEWSPIEWALRLCFCGLIFLRLSMITAKHLAPASLMQVLAIAALLLAVAGVGFYWLEPRVPSYGDGLWLAFITGATVGYGDIVPSTPASRIFAVFIVLLGYAVFSVVTGSIAALFVGEDEKRFEKELHSDIRHLRDEIVVLRAELHRALATGVTATVAPPVPESEATRGG